MLLHLKPKGRGFKRQKASYLSSAVHAVWETSGFVSELHLKSSRGDGLAGCFDGGYIPRVCRREGCLSVSIRTRCGLHAREPSQIGLGSLQRPQQRLAGGVTRRLRVEKSITRRAMHGPHLREPQP